MHCNTHNMAHWAVQCTTRSHPAQALLYTVYIAQWFAYGFAVETKLCVWVPGLCFDAQKLRRRQLLRCLPFEGFEISDCILGHVEISDYIPGHVSDYIARSQRATPYTFVHRILCTVINRPKSRIWASFRHFSKKFIACKTTIEGYVIWEPHWVFKWDCNLWDWRQSLLGNPILRFNFKGP